MKILIFSPAFLPMIGGLENMAYMLAKEWSEAGNAVTIVTNASKGEFNDEKENFVILRNIQKRNYWKVYLESDLIFFLNVSLKGIWPTLIKRKNVFVSHQITYYNIHGKINLLEQIKRQISRIFINISCSNFVRDTLPQKQGFVIPNAYDSSIFFSKVDQNIREKDIVFVGRLVSDKGLDTLLHALAIIKRENNLILGLEIIGDGPEINYLKRMTKELLLTSQVKFIGKMTGTDLCKKINEHKIMVVPSKWKEPFGLVALEGLACGCKMVISKHGGLKEAVGNLADEFENGDEYSLAHAILSSLQSPLILREIVEKHLNRHTAKNISQQYLNLFNKTG